MSLNDKVNVFQEEKLNAKHLSDYEWNIGLWNWPLLNGVIDLVQGVANSVGDLVEGVVWIINPFNWDDLLKGVVWVINPFHWDDAISGMWETIKITYEEEGLLFCTGYVIPEVAAYFIGAGEVKAVSEVEKLEHIEDATKIKHIAEEGTDATKIVDDMVDVGEYIDDIANTLDDFNSKYPDFEKPKNANTPEKWYDRGGKMYIDDIGITHYVKDINGTYYDIPYTDSGPDFSDYYYVGMNPFTYDQILEDGVELTGKNSYSDNSIPGPTDQEKLNDLYGTPEWYTWHHESDGTMSLVPKDIHGEINHTGGASGYRKGELP